jgi:hypothetical protein
MASAPIEPFDKNGGSSRRLSQDRLQTKQASAVKATLGLQGARLLRRRFSHCASEDRSFKEKCASVKPKLVAPATLWQRKHHRAGIRQSYEQAAILKGYRPGEPTGPGHGR